MTYVSMKKPCCENDKKTARQPSRRAGVSIRPPYRVGSPDDALERQADAVSGTLAATGTTGAPRIQRAPSSTEPSASAAGPEIQHGIAAAQGGGMALAGRVQAEIQPHFRHDFSRVRVHDDEDSAAMSRQLGARAFTVGSDIFFSRGAYRPQTASGRRLLTHELTHVVQQSHDPASGLIQREMNTTPAADEQQSAQVDRFASCDADQPELEAGLKLAHELATQAHSRAASAFAAKPRPDGAKTRDAVMDAFSAFFGDDALHDDAKKQKILATVTSIRDEVKDMYDHRTQRLTCHSTGSGAAQAEYVGGEDRHYIIYPNYFTDNDPLSQAHALIHEAAHHVTKNAGDLYTDVVSARALPHLTGLTLDRNQDTLAGFIIAAARGTNVGMETVSHEYLLRPDASISPKDAEKIQIVGELMRWVFMQAYSFLTGEITIKGTTTRTVNALLLEILHIAAPFAMSAVSGSKRSEQTRREAVIEDPSAATEDAYAEASQTRLAREQDLATVRWWQDNAAGILSGAVEVPTERAVPAAAMNVLVRWSATAGSGGRVQIDNPGFRGHLSSKVMDAARAVALPIPFSDVGLPNTAISRAITIMMEAQMGVPETVSALMLSLFNTYPFKGRNSA